jgi:hypothetical protein
MFHGRPPAVVILVLSIAMSASNLSGQTLFKATAQSFDAGGTGTTALAVADVNGDGKPDLIVANDCSDFNPCLTGNFVAVMLGNGDGTFRAGQAISWDFSYFNPGLAVEDVNGDGKPDIVAAYQGGIAVSLGNGDGTFQAPKTYPTIDNYGSALVIRDVNGDGKADLVIADACSSSVGCIDARVNVLLGNGDGSFQAAKSYDAGGGSGGPYGAQGISLAVADVNGDGKLDVLTGISGYTGQGFPGSVGVLLGNGDGSFQAPYSYSSGGLSVASIAIADLNGDGKADVVVSNWCTTSACNTGSIAVLAGNGEGTFQPATVTEFSGFDVCCVALGDVTRDGKIDIAFGIHQKVGLTGAAVVLVGNGNGTFQPAQTFYSDGDLATSLALADVNGDGKLDLLVTNACFNCNTLTHGNAVVRLNNYFAPTTTTIRSTPSVSVYGQAVTVTATVQSAGMDSPTGKVTFQQNGTWFGAAVLNAGIATLTTSKLPVGALSLTGTYIGDTFSARSTSAAIKQTVTQAQIGMMLTSTPNPSTLGQSVKFTATFTSTGGLPTGTVTFSNGSTTLGTAQINAGKATFLTTALPHGTDQITATYTGNVDYCSASGSIAQVVN